MYKHTPIILALFWLIVGISNTSAQDFVYTPKNPAFGGSDFNYAWLLNSANAQNTIEEEKEESLLGNQNQLEQFTESLNRQLLNQISRNLFSDQFGQDGLTEGTFLLGDFQIEITEGLDGINIIIFDLAGGGQTSILVPFF
ncbi:MAG: curli production assembly protein CsgF [Saprospiraceae bacterium]|nr:MAG: curli production assembly protein CsgF [Saprospiraceae bacterium]